MKTITKEQFDALGAHEKRVAVANDALHERVSGRFKVKVGKWLGSDTEVKWKQEELRSGTVTCEGCALGGMMYSLIRLGNAFSSSKRTDYIAWEQFRDRLAEVFDEEQLQCIEVAFECGDGAYNVDRYVIEDDVPVPEWFDSAAAFGRRFPKPEERFTSIMTNIVENGGTFVP